MRTVLLVLAAALACSAPPSGAPDPIPAAAPVKPAPRVFAELDRDGRRDVCEHIVDRVRMACDPQLRELDAALVEQCMGDHPIWACPQVVIADHQRCLAGKDAAACADHQRQTEECGVRAALQQCKLVVESVAPQSPAEAAGLHVGDVLLSLDGVARSVEDNEGIIAAVKRSGGRALRFTVVKIGNPTRDVSITPAGAPLKIGATFAPSPTCSGFHPRFTALPCRAGAGAPGE